MIKHDLKFAYELAILDEASSKAYVSNVLNITDAVIFPNGPHLAQCIGTKRLWGAFMGTAYAIDANDIENQEIYEKIALLSRTYLVIQDHLMDEQLSDNLQEICTNMLLQAELELEKLFFAVDVEIQEFKDQCQRGWDAFENCKSAKTDSDLFLLARQKCEIFFNPYAIDPKNLSYKELRLNFLSEFFNICQMLDDFHDIEDDINNIKQQNLFLFGRTQSEKVEILSRRYEFSPSVVKEAQLRLSRFEGELNDNPILDFYYNHATDWLDSKIDLFEKFHPGNAEYIWNNKPPFITLLPRTSETEYPREFTIHAERLRPEFLQTELAGISTIPEIEQKII